jgi:glycosyltransferase involved in cell wall biosynthesis
VRVNWLTYTDERDYDRVESTLWIRGYQLFPYLAERGIECVLNAPPDAARVAVLLRWQDARAWEAARAVKRAGGRIVFDLCVDYFEESGVFPGGYGSSGEQAAQARRMTEEADAVTCASEEIARSARRFHPRVEHLPDSVDFRHFRFVKEAGDFLRPRLRAVWSGVSAKADDLGPVLPLLAGHGIDLTIVSDRDPFPRFSARWMRWKKSLRYRFVPWHYATFPERILDGEICLSPRDLRRAYNRGHSHFKIAVFMAEGVPAIASPVPSYVELLKGGEGGRICRDEAEWDRALGTACADRSVLMRQSAACRSAAASASTEAVSRRYAALFAELAGSEG